MLIEIPPKIINVPQHWPPRYNACTDPCDMINGPCACGAWHCLDEEWVIGGLKSFGMNEKPPPTPLQYIELSFWKKGQVPVSDAPWERFCIMEHTLERTLKFANEAIRIHWYGECNALDPSAHRGYKR